jgi:hypothetical protein
MIHRRSSVPLKWGSRKGFAEIRESEVTHRLSFDNINVTSLTFGHSISSGGRLDLASIEAEANVTVLSCQGNEGSPQLGILERCSFAAGRVNDVTSSNLVCLMRLSHAGTGSNTV